jgi:hypothetical protein
MAAGDGAAERTTFANEMLLADELIEGSRAHPRRKWLLLGRRLEQGLGAGTGGSGRGAPGGHAAMVRVTLAAGAAHLQLRSDSRPTSTCDVFGTLRARILARGWACDVA